MSRGIKVFYASQSNALPTSTGYRLPGDPQLGDYCIVKSDIIGASPRVIQKETVEGFIETDTYQARTFKWNSLNAWEEVENFEFTDETMISNVTKIRKAHMDDYRSLIKAIQDNKLNKYGDFYYNTHNYTNSVMLWSRDTDLARIYLGDYGSDAQYLTVEFGDNRGSFSGDRVRFLYRNLATTDYVMDILGDEVRIYQNITVDGITTLKGDVTMNSNLHVLGSTDIDTDLNVDGNTTLHGTAVIDGATTIHNTLQVDLTIEADQNIGTDLSLVSRIPTGTPPLFVDSTTKVDNLQADSVDGEHVVTHSNGRIPLRDTVPGNNGNGAVGPLPNTGLNADTLDGWHYWEIEQKLPSISYNGSVYKDSANNIVGNALAVVFGGSTHYVPANSVACGCTCTCTCNCLGNCHSKCAKWG